MKKMEAELNNKMVTQVKNFEEERQWYVERLSELEKRPPRVRKFTLKDFFPWFFKRDSKKEMGPKVPVADQSYQPAPPPPPPRRTTSNPSSKYKSPPQGTSHKRQRSTSDINCKFFCFKFVLFCLFVLVGVDITFVVQVVQA